MNDKTHEPVALSAEGLRRKLAIERSLVAGAADRRLGRAVLGGAACIALGLGATFLVRGSVVPTRGTSPIADHRTTLPDQRPQAVHPSTTLAAAHIHVVTNEPISDRPCAQPGGTASAGVCLLSDAQLLSALSQTGQSYGIVRVGGAVHVVLNSGSQ